jgi:hypothetical protein
MYDPIFAAPRRDGANFPVFVVARRSKVPTFVAPPSWKPEKLAPVAAVLIVLTGPSSHPTQGRAGFVHSSNASWRSATPLQIPG